MKKFIVALIATGALAIPTSASALGVGGWCYWNENPYSWSWSPGYQVHFVYSYSYPDNTYWQGGWIRVYWIADPGYTNIRPLYGPCPWP